MQGDCPVKVSTQEVSLRETLTVGGTAISDTWSVIGLPRQMVWANQTSAAPAMSLTIEFAIRDSAVAGVPEWLLWAIVALVPGGATPVITQIVTGAVWLRFTVSGAPGQVAELACTAFV